MAVKKSSSEKPHTRRKSPVKNASSPALVEENGSKPAETTRMVVVEEEIRIRAYEIYEARGRQPGFDQDDWIRAETEILSRLKESA